MGFLGDAAKTIGGGLGSVLSGPIGLVGSVLPGGPGGGLGGFVDKLPVVGPLLGPHKEEQAKQKAMQDAINQYQQQRQKLPDEHFQVLQNQLNELQPVNHILTRMYGPQAYQTFGPGPNGGPPQALDLRAPLGPIQGAQEAQNARDVAGSALGTAMGQRFSNLARGINS